jgi:type I restriction enzyme, S subunit
MKWSEVEMGQICLTTEQGNPSDKPDAYFEYIDISSVDKDLKIISRTQSILGSEAPSRARKIIREGDVLVSTVRPNLNTVALVPRSLDQQIASTGFCVLRPNPKCVIAKYLFYRATTPDFVAFLVAKMRGANYPAVTDAVIRQAPIPWPPLREQYRIVEILDQADALRRKRAEADAKAVRILPALFYQMFGNPVSNPRQWPVVPLNDLGKTWSGGAFPLKEQGQGAGEIPFIKVSDMNTPGNEVFIRSANHWVSKETLRQLSVRPAPQGTIVFPKIGAAIATNKKRLLTMETAFDNNVIGVVPISKESTYYLYMFFQLFDLRRLSRTTALPSIKPSELAVLPIPRPPLKLQEDFGRYFLAAVDEFAKQHDAGDMIQRLFANLQHRAFSGDLTAKWREAHMKELLAEMEQQAKALEATC